MDMMRAFLKGFGDHLIPDERDPSVPPDPPPPLDGEPVEEEPPIKEAPIDMDGRVMNPVEFVRHVLSLEAPTPHPTRVFLHHTWRPTPETWQGSATMAAMKAYYEQQIWEDAEGRKHEGWTAGPHLFIAQDGIWLFSDLRFDGVGVYGHNYRSRHIEMVGNYDEQLPTGAILENTIVALGILHEWLGLDIDDLNFHRDFSTKSCPGWAVQKDWIIPQVRSWITAFRQANSERLSALRRSLAAIVENQLVGTNPNAALAKAAQERGYLGALTHEIPMEIDDQPYLVQLFAEALLVPVPKWDDVQTLREYEQEQSPTKEAKRRGTVPPPTDPYNYQT